MKSRATNAKTRNFDVCYRLICALADARNHKDRELEVWYSDALLLIL